MKTVEAKIVKEEAVIGCCPECSGNVVEIKQGFKCKGRDCQFIIWKEDRWLYGFYKRTVTKAIAKAILTHGWANIKGLWSEAKKENFDAKIYFRKNEKGYWGFSFR